MAAVVGGVLAGTAAGAAVAALLWDRFTARAVECLPDGGSTSEGRVFSLKHLQSLPEPVIRYLSYALTPDQPLIRRARVEQAGEFRLGDAAPWSPLTAVQYYAVDPPGFVWDARIRMAPLLTVRVRDSYLDGAGSVQAKVASLVTLVDERGRHELDQGALHRYLAEAVWFPTALLPGRGIEWRAIHETAAVATLTDAANSVSLEFQFGAHGEIVGACTPVRQRVVKGEYVPTPWACSYRSYAEVGGMRVPSEAEVAWLLPGGRCSYFRGRVTTIDYEFA